MRILGRAGCRIAVAILRPVLTATRSQSIGRSVQRVNSLIVASAVATSFGRSVHSFHYRVKPARLLFASQMVFGSLIAIMTGVLIVNLRNHAISQAEHELRTTSSLLAEQADRAFEAVDLVQVAMLERLQNENVRTPEDFRQHASGLAVHEELRNRAAALPQLDAITVIDASGNLVNFSRFWPIPMINVADRDYFIALRGDPARTTFISAPVQNRGSGSWTIYYARKVTGPEHAFLGLVLAAMPLDYFEHLYRTVAAGPDSAISMFRGDGVLLARYPHSDLQIGKSFGQGLAFLNPGAAATNSIVVRKVSQVDGRERLIAATALIRFPLGVNAMDSLFAILAEWRSQAMYLIVTAAALEILIVAIGFLMLRQLTSQRMLNEARAAQAEAETELAVAHAREQADRAFHTQTIRFRAALGNMSQALCMFDANGCLVTANSRLAAMFGLAEATVVPGMNIGSLLGHDSDAASELRADRAAVHASIQQLRAAGKRATCVRNLDDGRILAITFVPVEDDGWLVTLEDITESQIAQIRISHMAHHDALTGLANRVLFYQRLSEAVARGRRGESSAVLCVDLDRFKLINDTLGHPIGDALLRAVTQRLEDQVRATDTLARLGGDEFAVVQLARDQPQAATTLARRLIEKLGEPFDIEGHLVIVGASIGIAVVPTDGADPDEILKNADMALYRAKADGRGRYCFFKPAMNALMQARRIMEIDLRKALAGEEFTVFHQPLMNLATNSICGFEALLRWMHPERGLIPPLEFIPFAEEIGLLLPLGTWVLRQACFDAMTWPSHLKVAVNVSVTQFTSRTLVEDVAAALRDSGLASTRLELEITETVMLEDTADVLRILHELRGLGVGIALDDFGTGYSSLSYLRRFPFTKVKIDRSFIEGLGKTDDADAIVTAMINLCTTLGMVVLAEGIETEGQLHRLRQRNCGEGQGYLFSPPRPASHALTLCKALTRPDVAEVAG